MTPVQASSQASFGLVASSLLAYPSRFREDPARPYGLVRWFGLCRCARENHPWKDPHQPSFLSKVADTPGVSTAVITALVARVVEP